MDKDPNHVVIELRFVTVVVMKEDLSRTRLTIGALINIAVISINITLLCTQETTNVTLAKNYLEGSVFIVLSVDRVVINLRIN